MSQILSFDAWLSLSDKHNRAVRRSPWLDQYCCRSEWLAGAHLHLADSRKFVGVTDSKNFVCFAGPVERGTLTILEPLEAMWGLGSPIVGTGALELLLESDLIATSQSDAALITGVTVGSQLDREMHQNAYYQCHDLSMTSRLVADLAHGFENYWRKRPKNLRRSVRRSVKKFAEAGGTIEKAYPPYDQDTWQRILSLERRSWKGQLRVGMADTMASFYQALLAQRHRDSEIQLHFAMLEGEDVGYILGVMVDSSYRGLQFSFDNERREYAIGNVLQHHQLVLAANSGCVTYDFGTDMEYKSRWATRHVSSRNCLLVPFH